MISQWFKIFPYLNILLIPAYNKEFEVIFGKNVDPDIIILLLNHEILMISVPYKCTDQQNGKEVGVTSGLKLYCEV